MHSDSKMALVLLFSVFVCVSCSSKKHEIACRAHLYSAYFSFQQQDPETPIQEVKLARKHAEHLIWNDWCVVEAYDDAGLYYFMKGDTEESRINQSVAVLLAYSSPALEKMYPFYLGNLGKIYSRLGMEGQYTEITRDPMILLKDPAVKANRHVKQKFATPDRRE